MGIKRGQVAIEYILIFGFILLVTTGILGIVGQRIIHVQSDNNKQTRQNILDHINSRIELAKAADNGFETAFVIPDKIDGLNFSVNISDNSVLIVDFADKPNYEALLNSTIGKFCYKRPNIPHYLINVKKVNGIVEVTSCPDCEVSYQRCDNAEEESKCLSLPEDVLNECRESYCKCLS
ncbi:MAG: Flp family type IVb pilin [Nanobdellota archaeon]